MLRESPAIEIPVEAPPAGADIIGRSFWFHGTALQRRTGDVYEASVRLGAFGDVRDAPAPRFGTPGNDLVRVETRDLGTTITRTPQGIESTREWMLHVTPKKTGVTRLPPLVMQAYDVETYAVRELTWNPNYRFNVIRQPPALPQMEPKKRSRFSGSAVSILLLIVVAGGLVALNRLRGS